MDMGKVEDLHSRGQHATAVQQFSEMCIGEIRGQYTIPDSISHLVHYTTLEALFSMLGVMKGSGDPVSLSKQGDDSAESDHSRRGGFLRLYDTFYSNDPNEGYFFVNSVEDNHRFRTDYRATWDLFERRSVSPAYMTSLVCVDDLKQVDDLVFWRTYGREGSGCALTFPIDRFKDKCAPYQVQYGEQRVLECLDALNQMLDEYVKISGAEQVQNLASFERLPKILLTGLSPLVYLHKSDDYVYEKEARIVMPYSEISDELYLDASSASSPVTWRHFAHLPGLKIKNLLVSFSSITLGPTVASPANAQFVLQRVLEEQGLYGVTVEPSSISYRR